MIYTKNIKYFCCEDISLIENYKEAVESDKVYHCHHRNEILLNKSREELKELGLYFKRPASELIFLEAGEHKRLHSIGNTHKAKWLCPLKLIYMYNVLGYKQETICDILGVKRQKLSREFKKFGIKRRYNTK